MYKVKNRRKFRNARIWSNDVLRKYAKEFTGSICNVSGWKDDDKEGHKYKDYFERAKEYHITNFGGYRGEDDNTEIMLDLEKELPEDLKKRFTVIFNHTVLEHIFNVEKAFKNLCEMAEDACIIVVPFIQEVHVSESYNDYWRFSPFAIEELFKKNGFQLVVCEYNNQYNTSVYLFCIGIRTESLNKYSRFNVLTLDNKEPVGRWIGNDNKLIYAIQSCMRGLLKFIIG